MKLVNAMSLVPIAPQKSGKNRLKAGMPAEDEEKEESLLRRIDKLEKDLEKSFQQIRDNLGSIAVAGKDILNLREVQRVMVSDLDSLKAAEKSRFKALVPVDLSSVTPGKFTPLQPGQSQDQDMIMVKI